MDKNIITDPSPWGKEVIIIVKLAAPYTVVHRNSNNNILARSIWDLLVLAPITQQLFQYVLQSAEENSVHIISFVVSLKPPTLTMPEPVARLRILQ